ncbi:MAG: DUF4912 domain-containing protein [Treponema sp.]|jgi:hypothetical protein|nr:DUF4912 domain-containing protein [Treponema sp.]
MDATLIQATNLKRPYLESLTTQELVQLADSFGIDIPPELDRIFIIEELMESAEEEEAAEAPANTEALSHKKLLEKRITEPVPLPRQYNITFIEVMLRDPLWAFTFWEVKSDDKETYEKADDFSGYQLKVSEYHNSQEPFTIPVGTKDDAWYIGFPLEGGCFKIELCALCSDEEIVLATSRPFTMPRLLNPLEDVVLYKNPLIHLSGIEDFTILRNNDRESRIKQA